MPAKLPAGVSAAVAAVSLAAALALTACALAAPAATAPTAPVASAAAAPAVPAAPAVSAVTGAGQPVSPELAARLTAGLSNAKGAIVRTTPVAGVYEVSRGVELVYVTADGRYGFAGDLYQLANSANLSDPRRRELRLALLGGVGDQDAITFASAAPRYTVTVFTDVDCQYCRRLHSQIDQYNRLGISVRYLFFPRSGPNTDSWFKAEQVWCSADRKSALTHAKLGESIPAKRCDSNPVARDYALGEKLGVAGTPYIFTDTGEMYEGLVEPVQLAAALQRAHASPAVTTTR